MERVLVTGGTGFVGQSIVSALISAGYEVIVGARTLQPWMPVRTVQFVQFDMRDERSVDAVVRSLKPVVIINSAALSSTSLCEQKPYEALEVNYKGVERLLAAADSNGSFLVQISTESVLLRKPALQDEDAPLPERADTVYGETKRLAEVAVRQRTSQHLIVRLPKVYGNYAFGELNSDNFVIPVSIRHELENGVFSGFADAFDTFVYVSDVGAALAFLLARNEKGTVHVAGPERVSYYHFASLVAQHYGLEQRLRTEKTLTDHPERQRPGLSAAKLRSLGFSPRYLHAGLEDCLEPKKVLRKL